MIINWLKKKAKANKVETILILSILSIIPGTMAWKTLNQDSWHSDLSLQPGDEDRLRLAVQNYWQDHQDQLAKTAQQISPKDLAEGGYLDSLTTERWESIGIKIQLPEAVEGGSAPSDVIIEATMATGDKIVLLADGSVQNRVP